MCYFCIRYLSVYGEVFKKISFGITFNVKKYSRDAEIFGILRSCDKNKLSVDEKEKRKYTQQPAENSEVIKENDEKLSEVMGIQRFGSNIPELTRSFENSNIKVPKNIMNSIHDLNYSQPKPVQMAAISVLSARRHALICAPTGSGKTLAYLFPIVCNIGIEKPVGVRALIVLPTKELATQIFNEAFMLTRFSKIRCLKLSSGGKSKSKDINKYNIVIATPQRLVELMERAIKLDLSKIKWLILDEGDLLLHNDIKSFKEQIAVIYNSCESSSTRCIFSATINNEIENWVQLYLNDPITILIGSKNSPPEEISQELIFTGQESGKIIALRNIFKKCLDPPILIFVNCIETAKELFSELMYDGINVAAMHSEKNESQRINLVNSFRTGKIWVLITTDLMSRGIDFKGIKTVFNYDVPNSSISYIHRIGRTGRAGVPGSAITFYTESDLKKVKELLPILKRSKAKYPEYIDKI